MAFPLQPEILIAHPWMGRGGSEATAMWALHALQDRAKVTFTTSSPVDWDSLNAAYGTRVSPDKVTLLEAPRLPGVNSGTVLAYWQRAYFERFCLTLGDRFDACISAYNPIRFGKPAIQLIGDFSFSEKCRLDLYPNASEQVHHRPSLLRRTYLSIGEKLAGRTNGTALFHGDRVVANSRWTAGILDQRFQPGDVPILYPPSSRHQPDNEVPRDPLGFVCMGRITPEKEFETILGILDRVRAEGDPVTLDLIGKFGGDAYSTRIEAMVAERREWIRTPGFLGPREKGSVFSSNTFGLHACRVEAFGIAVAEMAAAGLVPFVPAEGGTREIVGCDGLVFQDAGDAARKIISCLRQPENLGSLRQQLQENVARFTPERFAENLVGIVQDFLGRPL